MSCPIYKIFYISPHSLLSAICHLVGTLLRSYPAVANGRQQRAISAETDRADCVGVSLEAMRRYCLARAPEERRVVAAAGRDHLWTRRVNRHGKHGLRVRRQLRSWSFLM